MSDQTNPTDEAKNFSEAVGTQPQASDKEIPEVKVEQTTEEKPAEEVKSDPPVEEQEHDYKKRFDGVNQANRQLSEKYQRTIDLNAKLVEKNPDLLDEIAEADPELANEVSKKVNGSDFESFKKSQELEGIKETDPEKYETEKRLRNLESKEQQRREEVKAKFYESRGIKINSFDPNYQKVEEQLSNIKPEFVEENLERALELAHGFAFPSNASDPEKVEKDKHVASLTTKSGGGKESPPFNPGKTKQISSEAQAFKDKLGLSGK